MAKTLQPLISEVDAGDGSSAIEVYDCLWSERGTVELPIIGQVYAGHGRSVPDLLVARRRAFEQIPGATAADDHCKITVEYATPELASPPSELDKQDPEDPESPPQIAESIETDSEVIRSAGWRRSSTEDLMAVEVEWSVPIWTYSIEVLYSASKDAHFAAFLKTVNAAGATIGGSSLTITGAAEELLLDSYRIAPEWRQEAGGLVKKYRTALRIRKRIPAWNYIWVAPEPVMDSQGRLLIYEYNKPYTFNATHPLGSGVYRPLKRTGENDYLDFTKIGWQKIYNTTTNPATGTAFNRGPYATANWANFWP